MVLDLRTVVMSDVVDNVTLRNEKRHILIKTCVGYGVTPRNYNKSKSNVKEAAIAVNNFSKERTLKERTWSDDDSVKEIDNTPVEEVDSKFKTSLEK